MRIWISGILATVLALLAGCGEGPVGEDTTNPRAWVGSWVQVNFLGADDNGVWGEDDMTGVGFTAEITDTTWTEKDGDGHWATYAFHVSGGNRYSKVFKKGNIPSENSTGRLELSSDSLFMIEYFDLAPGDDLVAFKWMRQ